MAEPVRFCGFNRRLVAAPGMKNTGTLYVHTNGVENISCWKFDPGELKRVIESGEVWFTTKSGETLYPIFLSGHPLMEARDGDTGEPTVYHSDGTHIIEDARRFATLYHGDQKYGDKPYTYHTEGVVEVLADFGANWDYLVTGHLHDFEEDCLQDRPLEERRALVANRYGTDIESMVWCCTGLMFIDGVKQDRKARNLQQYVKINALPMAAPVKCADRIFNMEECVRTESSMGKVYLGEVLEFDINVGVFCPAPMRQRLFKAALAIAEYTKSKPDIVAPIAARLAEIDAAHSAALAA